MASAKLLLIPSAGFKLVRHLHLHYQLTPTQLTTSHQKQWHADTCSRLRQVVGQLVPMMSLNLIPQSLLCMNTRVHSSAVIPGHIVVLAPTINHAPLFI